MFELSDIPDEFSVSRSLLLLFAVAAACDATGTDAALYPFTVLDAPVLKIVVLVEVLVLVLALLLVNLSTLKVCTAAASAEERVCMTASASSWAVRGASSTPLRQ